MRIERIKSGIPGLDEKLRGGFERGSMTVVNGGPGSGKTIFGIEFIMAGLNEGEKCAYISFEEGIDDIKNDMLAMSLDPEPHLASKQLSMVFLSPINFEYLDVLSSIKNSGIKRLVIDSISALSLYFKDRFAFEKFALDFIRALKDIGVTGVLVFEHETSSSEGRFADIQYLCDAVISLSYSGMGGDYDRSLQIVKCRRTDHYRELIPMKINHDGLVVK